MDGSVVVTRVTKARGYSYFGIALRSVIVEGQDTKMVACRKSGRINSLICLIRHHDPRKWRQSRKRGRMPLRLWGRRKGLRLWQSIHPTPYLFGDRTQVVCRCHICPTIFSIYTHQARVRHKKCQVEMHVRPANVVMMYVLVRGCYPRRG